MGFLRFAKKQRKTIAPEHVSVPGLDPEPVDQKPSCPIADTFITPRKSISFFDDIMKELSEPLAASVPANDPPTNAASHELTSRPPSMIRSASASVIKTPLPAQPPSSHHQADSSDEGDSEDEEEDVYDRFEELPVIQRPPSITSSSSSTKLVVPKPMLSNKVVLDRMKERHRLDCRRSMYTNQTPTISRQHSFPSMPTLVRSSSGLPNIRSRDYSVPMTGYLPMNRFSSHENMVRSVSAYASPSPFMLQDQQWAIQPPRIVAAPQVQPPSPLQAQKIVPPTPPPETNLRLGPTLSAPQPILHSSSTSSTTNNSHLSETPVERVPKRNTSENPRLPPKLQQELQWMKLRRAQYSVPNLAALQEEEGNREGKHPSKTCRSLPSVREGDSSTNDDESIESVKQRIATSVGCDTPHAPSYIHACPKPQQLNPTDNGCHHPTPPTCQCHHPASYSPPVTCSHAIPARASPGALTKSTSWSSIAKSTNNVARCRKHQPHHQHHHHHHYYYHYHYSLPPCQHHHHQPQQALCQHQQQQEQHPAHQQEDARAGLSGNDFVTA
ncbi:hypothetical protein EC973_002156 [Apophysomyces ossiformis]|uniref:Uncharacterized protein n=1 Tax=Apophysomyces ossiformis TaxID=679940 RepID=A0A8H7BH09_9FUNG|nr:hypothetical protein EC973_002156 [Apophysomyces ossiformis]